MTPAQNSLYWRLWNAACITQGWKLLSADDQNAKRHAAHATALGRDKSSKELNNRDLDSVFATFKALANPLHVATTPETARHFATAKGERRRLIYRIEMILPKPYVDEICRDKFGTTNLDQLTVLQLDQLRVTLIERKRARDRREKLDAVAAAPKQEPIIFPSGTHDREYHLKPRSLFRPSAPSVPSNP